MREAFEADVTALTLAVFVVPQLLAMVLEPLLLVWAERWSRPLVLACSVFGMALSIGLGALCWDATSFAVAFAVYAPSSGVACGTAQAALMAAKPDAQEQSMTDWTLAGYAGDLGTPALLWATASLGWGWRAAFGLTSLVACGLSLSFLALYFSARSRGELSTGRAAEFDTDEASTEEAVGALAAFRLASANRPLMLWLSAVAACSFMDEILGVLVGLRVHERTGEVGAVAEMLMAFTAGGIVGLGLLRALLRRLDTDRLLVGALIGCLFSYAAWLALPMSPAATAAMFASGLFASAHYPLAQARAYRALPHRPALVAATAQVFSGFDLVLPVALGMVADRFGLTAALLLLSLQPLGILGLWGISRRVSVRRG